ncbi:TAXI family TRAP transporter solute-binding subunit [Chloroflexota bacterium]
MKQWLIIMAVVLLAVALLTGSCTPKPAAPTKHEIVNLEIQSSSAVGTPPYVKAMAITGMLNELHPWLRASALESLGSADAVHATDALRPERKKYVFIPNTTTVSQVEALMGLPPYKREFTDLKLLATVGSDSFSFVTYDPNIKSYKDLIGKRVGTLPKTMAPWPICEALLRDAWGILDQVKLSHHKPPDYKDIMTAGVVDAVYATAGSLLVGDKFGYPPYIMQVIAARKSYWVDVSPEDIDRVREKNPWPIAQRVIAKGALGEDKPPQDTGCAVFYSFMVAWDVADDEVTYELVKFLDENAEEWSRRTGGVPGGAEFMASFPGMTEDEVHPAALRYYKEKGVKIGG